MSHTPGPWFAAAVMTADDGWTFMTVGPFDTSDRTDQNHYEDTIAEVSGINYRHQLAANARLISAAPDMLAALKDAVQTARNYYAMFHDETWKERLTKWDAAIAKAEGAQR